MTLYVCKYSGVSIFTFTWYAFSFGFFFSIVRFVFSSLVKCSFSVRCISFCLSSRCSVLVSVYLYKFFFPSRCNSSMWMHIFMTFIEDSLPLFLSVSLNIFIFVYIKKSRLTRFYHIKTDGKNSKYYYFCWHISDVFELWTHWTTNWFKV